jgi:hypothetical protein
METKKAGEKVLTCALTGESACPTFVSKHSKASGAGAFACQPVSFAVPRTKQHSAFPSRKVPEKNYDGYAEANAIGEAAESVIAADQCR